MSKETKIQWCDSTINPVMACNGCELWAGKTKVCYAGILHTMRHRHKGFSPDFLKPKLFPGRMAAAARWSDLSGWVRPGKPWLDGYPRLIFVSDMGDALSMRNCISNANRKVGNGSVPFAYLKGEIIDTVISERGQQHIWLWLNRHR